MGRATGYRRIWFDDGLHDFTGEAAPASQARVTCPTCGADWAEGGYHFWAHLRSVGSFPSSCPACGGLLPQWRIVGIGNTTAAQAGQEAAPSALKET